MKEPNMFHNYETEKITRKASDAGPSKSYPVQDGCIFQDALQDGEGWATGRHQFLITLLLVCEKWMRTLTRRSLGDVVLGFPSLGVWLAKNSAVNTYTPCVL